MTALRARRGFTLIELLVALLILSLLALMSYRGLGAVLEARNHVMGQTQIWQRLSAFSARFQNDVQLAAPRPVRTRGGMAPPWLGTQDPAQGSRLEFSRFASATGVDLPRRVAYAMNGRKEIELWVWPGPDATPMPAPARYPVLAGVAALVFEYLDADLDWVRTWPVQAGDGPLPRAVRMRIVLATGEEIVRVFALDS